MQKPLNYDVTALNSQSVFFSKERKNVLHGQEHMFKNTKLSVYMSSGVIRYFFRLFCAKNIGRCEFPVFLRGHIAPQTDDKF